jgi:hypothetical protein
MRPDVGVDAFVNAIHGGLLYAAGAALVAAVSVAILLSPGKAKDQTQQPERTRASASSATTLLSGGETRR